MTSNMIVRRNGYHLHELMAVYNKARAWAVNTKKARPATVDKALSYLMSGTAQEKWFEYRTTSKSCECRGRRYGKTCSHIIGKWIDQRYRDAMRNFVWPFGAELNDKEGRKS